MTTAGNPAPFDKGSTRFDPLRPSGGGSNRTTLSGRRIYLAEVLDTLWSRPGVRPTATVKHFMLPSAKTPTLVVPTRPRRAAAAMLRSYKPSAGPVMRTGLAVLALGARLGLTNALPRVEVPSEWPTTTDAASDPADLDLLAYLSESLGLPLCAAVYTSPARANRKPILHLVTPEGDEVGYAKVGTNELTRELVRREADNLERLAVLRSRRVLVPTVLYRGRWRDAEVLVQRAVNPPRTGSIQTSDLHAAMYEVAGINGFETELIPDGDYVTRLRRRVAALPSGRPAGRLAAVLDSLLEDGTGQRLCIGAWHGDWTRWNMAAHGATLAVWDWERFEIGVPLGFDALHHRIQGQLVTNAMTPLHAARQLVDEAPTTLSDLLDGHLSSPIRHEGTSPGRRALAEMAHLTARLYLVEIGTRYLADRQEEAGARLGDLTTWLLPALESQQDSGL